MKKTRVFTGHSTDAWASVPFNESWVGLAPVALMRNVEPSDLTGYDAEFACHGLGNAEGLPATQNQYVVTWLV
jgi:hypothetical protein